MPRLAFAALWLWPALAFAHPLDVGYLQVRVDGARIDAGIDLDAHLAYGIAHLDEDQMSPEGAARAAPALLRATLDSSPMLADGDACVWSEPTAELRGMRVHIAGHVRCPHAPSRLTWPLLFLEEAPATTRILAKAMIDGREQELVVEPGRETVVLSGGPPRLALLAFVWMGIRHIGAAPSEWTGPAGPHLPAGIDHILFLLALILTGGGLGQTLETVTGFTAGHSVTLGLASLGIVHLSPRLTESAIALSIAYVAAEDLLTREPRHRWRIATAFGLVHGFGFASALADLHLTRSGMAQALVGFNVGVEVGQAIIVALLFPALLLLRRRPLFLRYGAPACAMGIFLAGTYWFAVRAF